LKSNVTIRKATFEDAAEIANVHINSWREAYKDLLPQDFLNERPLSFKNRYELWKRVTQESGQVTFVAESQEHGVVGVINGSNGRDAGLEDWCEVWCLYLLEHYHGKKIGFNLLQAYFDAHLENGFSKGYVWVLAGNPSMKFYERVGAINEGRVKEAEIAGQKVTELMFCWADLSL